MASFARRQVRLIARGSDVVERWLLLKSLFMSACERLSQRQEVMLAQGQLGAQRPVPSESRVSKAA